MNTPQYLMTTLDKKYVHQGELAAREIPKTSLMDFTLPEIKAAGILRPDYRLMYCIARDLPRVPAIYFLINRAGHIYYIGQSVNVFQRICGEHFETMGNQWIKLSVLALPSDASQEQLNYAEAIFIYIHQHKGSRNVHGKTMTKMIFAEILHRFRAGFEETIFPIALIDVQAHFDFWARNESVFLI
ncbi:GIY-YIG nuclease family protein [Polynucleobacter sp. Latsch14-2]|uniref:GIY-YIG nuclease family protein n=1 Tax=Polynucleobacter sp. Latsch14-2 TaxID=2576920 RepID=UPI001C0D6160|nr:GIY-YIG nuclease family protein [Polynucleobacter sp. Latsch14-2]MBU3614371.1 GIY-YIG nuclease family protein [Polynucleobacter sp. Latsch14-2]